jgi:ABC-type multidrug transport system ATPase subunit
VSDDFLKAEMVFKKFGHREILKGVFFRAEPRKVTALLGPNGCGKSTLFKLMAGVLRADGGQFYLGTKRILKPRLHRLARLGLFYLPQEPLLMPNMRVETQLKLFAGSPHFDPEVIPALDLAPFIGRRPGTLSGGERKRCDLAAAFLRRPRFLLMDEPFTGISPIDAEKISTVLRQMADAGCAIVITDHTVDWVLNLSDALWLLDDGTCRNLGDREQACSDEEFVNRYLGSRASHYLSSPILTF